MTEEDRIVSAKLVSHDQDHGLILHTDVGRTVAIPAGFASGYRGTGPCGLSYVLTVLLAHDIDTEEYAVSSEFMTRLNASGLTSEDVASLTDEHAIRPVPTSRYVFREDWEKFNSSTLWQEFQDIVPMRLVDPRICDIALSFKEESDHALITGYRRLEDILRKRTDVEAHGTKLISQVFRGDRPLLWWAGCNPSEQTGRANLFAGAFSAHRNARSHREPNRYSHDFNESLSEFLVLNHLYRLEATALKQGQEPPDDPTQRLLEMGRS